jgi:DNA-binding transcriptional LysR family regulator
MDKLSVMHAFRRIVERGSFARAADDLGVSPALLSREIKLLEESLGTTLLTRTTRSMSLTDAGRLYYDEATGILDAVTQVETRIRDGAGAVRGHLKVNASSSFGQTVIAPILPGFLDAYPDLRLTVSMDDRVVDMVEGGFDVSIRIRPAMPDSALVARRIGTMRQRIFAAPAYLERAGVPKHPQDIARHRVIGFLLADHLTTWALTGPGRHVSQSTSIRRFGRQQPRPARPPDRGAGHRHLAGFRLERGRGAWRTGARAAGLGASRAGDLRRDGLAAGHGREGDGLPRLPAHGAPVLTFFNRRKE